MGGNRLPSEKLIVESPFSFAGSAKRVWRLTWVENPILKALFAVVAVLLIGLAWAFVVCWYLLFGLLVVPYRLIRRSARREHRERLRHRETLAAIAERDRDRT